MKASKRSRAIDWLAVRQRLAQAAAVTERSLAPTPEQAQHILEKRARELAQPLRGATLASDVLDVTTFNLGLERCALATQHVLEVIRVVDCTPLPGAPAFVVGVVNLRGDILVVVDLRPFLGVARGEPTAATRVLVLGEERAELGILADAVHEVIRLRIEEIHERPIPAKADVPDWLRGVTPEALIVLDGATILQDSRLFIDQGDSVGP